MPSCAAMNCTNRVERGFRLFKFPADKERRGKWVINMQRANWEPTTNSRLCEVHFEESQFEQNRADGWKRLKLTAVPTLFSPPKLPPVISQPPRRSRYKTLPNKRGPESFTEQLQAKSLQTIPVREVNAVLKSKYETPQLQATTQQGEQRMPSCYICGKTNNCYEMREMKYRLHVFPTKMPDIMKKWKDFARVPDGADFKKLVLCTKHFANKYVRRHPFYVKLQTGAVPTLFPPTPAQQKKRELQINHRKNPELNVPAILPLWEKRESQINYCTNAEPVLVKSEVSWDHQSPNESPDGDPLEMEEAECSYNEEVLMYVKDQLCRVCGMKRDQLLPIWPASDATEGDTLTLSKKIELCLSLVVNVEDGLPTNICVDCHKQVESWHELYTTSLAADSILKEMFTIQKKKVASQNVSEEIRSDSSIQPTHSSSGKLLGNTDYGHWQSSNDLTEVVVRRFLERIKGKLNGDLSNIIVETEANQPVSVINDHMYAKGGDEPLGKNVPSTIFMNNNERTEYRGIVDELKELLENVIKEHNVTDGEGIDHTHMKAGSILPPVYKCVYCQQIFSNKKVGLAHKRECALEAALCEICGRMVRARKAIKGHRAKHSPLAKGSWICEKCGKIFTENWALRKHMENVHAEGTFVCDPCCKVFASHSRLAVHMKQHEKGEVGSLDLVIAESELGGQWKCPVCGAEFKDKRSVILHMNERKKTKCMNCKRWILSERLAVVHKCSFTSCRFCSKRFWRSGGRYIHERLHTGEKPFLCKECGKAFASCAALINHRISHKPPAYKCEVCNKSFMRKTVYKDHMGFHAGIKHPCPHCSKVYNSRKAMCMHNAKIHGDRKNSADSQVVLIVENEACSESAQLDCPGK